VFPKGWFGFGISCNCEVRTGSAESPPVWVFRSPPEVYSVERGSPAGRVGLRRGDLLIEIDGVPLTSEEGGRRFGAVKAGQAVEFVYRRGGETGAVTIKAGERRVPGARRPEDVGRLRYVGTVGDVEVEVRGNSSVIITVIEPGREIEIVTRDARIRLRRSK
jgi:C-terminal processing protease CtpA/Prc